MRILHSDVQEFIRKNLKADLYRLILRQSPFEGISSQELAQQISAMSKARQKLPLWFNTEKIYYPPGTNMEQSSGEIAAAYKASLFCPEKALDLTGGFGVDSYFISRKSGTLDYWETDEELASIAAHNFKQLGAAAINCHNGDGLEVLKAKRPIADLIYLDPSRRTRDNKRVFMLSDCVPDVPGNLHAFLNCAPLLLIKTSPLLDLSAGLSELEQVKEIHVVAVKNEVKELLWVLEKGFNGAVEVKTINFLKDESQEFEFSLKAEKSQSEKIGPPLSYLFEPNAAIMKSGGFNSLSQQLQLSKIHSHTHLFTSDRLVDFPGRKFRIRDIVPYTKKTLQSLPFAKANITTRNFPDSVAEIRKKTAIGDGGKVYLFFTRSAVEGLIMIECEKI